MNIFLDMKMLWIFGGGGGGHHKIGLYLGVISMRLKVFSYGQGQCAECGYFLGGC